MMVEKIRTSVSSSNSVKVSMLKCRIIRGVMWFLPPPGGPIAPTKSVSVMVLNSFSLRSYQPPLSTTRAGDP